MIANWRSLTRPSAACLWSALLVSSCAAIPARTPAIDPAHLSEADRGLCYIEASLDSGWFAQDIATAADLDLLAGRPSRSKGLIIPVFPTVYSPGEYYEDDVAYYNYVLRESAIREGNKVLVIGSGSGADTWAAWLKSKSQVYAIDINPLAVANTKVTSKLAGVPVNAIQGDIRTMSLPAEFAEFDAVLWNMPFLDTGDYRGADFHDHESGDVLDKFLEKLPRLLKPGGEAILLNTDEALGRIHFANMKFIKTERQSTSGSSINVIVIKMSTALLKTID